MKRTSSLLLFVVSTAVAASAAGPATAYKAPRTEDGRPDLAGVWNFDSAVPLQRPATVADRNYSLGNTLSAARKEDAAKKTQ